VGYVTPTSNVLDVGCGLGRVAQSLPGFLTSGTIQNRYHEVVDRLVLAKLPRVSILSGSSTQI
jgi:hypothetical protein